MSGINPNYKGCVFCGQEKCDCPYTGKAKPKRIQRKRTKGWQMPEGAVYVGRPTKWGNPFTSPEEWAADMFREFMGNGGSNYPSRNEIRAELRGKDLVCWCPLDQPCHADVLLEIANQPREDVGTPEGEVYPDWGHEPESQGNSEEASFRKAMSKPAEVWPPNRKPKALTGLDAKLAIMRAICRAIERDKPRKSQR